MAEPSKLLPPARMAEPQSYRPLSVPALIGFFIAAGYSLLLAALGAVAFASGTPLFLGMGVLVFPLAAILLALAGQRHVARSEGAVGGQALIAWTWRLVIVFGLGYGAYYLFTFLAVRMQARTFTDAWMEKLREGKTIDAFLDTQDPAQRKFDKPSEVESIYRRYGQSPPGTAGVPPLVGFQNKEIVRLVEEGGAHATVKPLGVRDWFYERAGYLVMQSYVVSTPYADAETQVVVHSSEGKEFEGRQWNVMANLTKLTGYARTPLGVEMERWLPQARQFAREWLRKMNESDLTGAFLDTLEPRQRLRYDRAYPSVCIADDVLSLGDALGTGAVVPVAHLLALRATVINPEVHRWMYLPAYLSFREGALVHADRLEARRNIRPEVARNVRELFREPWRFAVRVEEGRGFPQFPGADAPHAEIVEQARFTLYPEGRQVQQARYLCDVDLVMESDRPPLRDNIVPAWRVKALNLVRAGTPSEIGLTNPGQPPAGRGR